MAVEEKNYTRKRFLDLMTYAKADEDDISFYPEMVNNFSASDLSLLQLYYMWATRKVAEDKGISALIHDDKRKEQYMREYGAADWIFSGIVDHGYKGAARCSHKGSGTGGGHQLRYAFYVFSPSTGRELVFGRNCLSDLLGVSLSDVTKLEDILKETDMEVFKALNAGRGDKVVKADKPFNILYVLRKDKGINEKFVATLGKATTELFLNFVNARFVLPKRLRDRVLEAFEETIKETVWETQQLSLFSNPEYKYIRYLDTSYESRVLYTVSKEELVTPRDLNIDTLTDFPEYTVQVPLKQLISCALINAYVDHCVPLETVLKECKLSTESFMNLVGQIFYLCNTKNAPTTTRAERVLAYAKGVGEYKDVVDAFIGSVVTNNIQEFNAFSAVRDCEAIKLINLFMFIAMHPHAIVERLGGVYE